MELGSNLGAFGIGLGFGSLYLGFWEIGIGGMILENRENKRNME